MSLDLKYDLRNAHKLEEGILTCDGDGVVTGTTPATGKVGIMTDAGFVEITPVADVTDFVVAVGDLISVTNGVITKLEHV